MTYDEHIDYDNQLCEAEDKIIELQAELEQYRWILVSERLPKKEVVCLITTGSRTFDACLSDNLWWMWSFEHQDYKKRVYAYITHWKPIILPEQDQK